MPSPFILNFRPGESLLDISSIAIVVGVAWGNISIPVTALAFTPERIDRDYSEWRRNHPNATNEEIYDTCYSGNPNQDVFFGQRYLYNSSINGICIGLGEAGLLSAAGDALEGLIGRLANIAISNATSSGAVSASASQSSTNPLLHGLNGHDTYNLNPNLFIHGNYNVCIIQGVMGALFELSMAAMFIGRFRSMANCPTMFNYLYEVYVNSFACALIPTGSVGLVLPGAEVKLLYT